jgi:fructose-1,6-bisphosphatase I
VASFYSYHSQCVGFRRNCLTLCKIYGGIYGYPGDTKNKDGKLRLVHEVSPMSFLIEQAGGKASTGYGRIMDIHPQSLGEHVSTFMGSPDDIDEMERYLATDKDGDANEL